MNNKLVKAIVAGIVGTLVMTIFMKIFSLLGMPEMDPPGMMAGMMGMPLAVGFVMHFLIGITFAVIYVYLFNPKVPIASSVLKGALFGGVAFILAQIPMNVMDISPAAEDAPMPLAAIGGVVGHVVFGIAVALVAKNRK